MLAKLLEMAILNEDKLFLLIQKERIHQNLIILLFEQVILSNSFVSGLFVILLILEVELDYLCLKLDDPLLVSIVVLLVAFNKLGLDVLVSYFIVD